MTPDLAAATWRKASRSGGEGGNCVELAQVDNIGAVRDSKSPAGGILRVDIGDLLDAVKADRLAR